MQGGGLGLRVAFLTAAKCAGKPRPAGAVGGAGCPVLTVHYGHTLLATVPLAASVRGAGAGGAGAGGAGAGGAGAASDFMPVAAEYLLCATTCCGHTYYGPTHYGHTDDGRTYYVWQVVVEYSWEGLHVSHNGTDLIARGELAIHGWAPQPGWSFGLGARCGAQTDAHELRAISLELGPEVDPTVVPLRVSLNAQQFEPVPCVRVRVG